MGPALSLSDLAPPHCLSPGWAVGCDSTAGAAASPPFSCSPSPLSPCPPGRGGHGVRGGRQGQPGEQPDPYERLLQAQGLAGLPGGATLPEPTMLRPPACPAVPVLASQGRPLQLPGPLACLPESPFGLLATSSAWGYAGQVPRWPSPGLHQPAPSLGAQADRHTAEDRPAQPGSLGARTPGQQACLLRPPGLHRGRG